MIIITKLQKQIYNLILDIIQNCTVSPLFGFQDRKGLNLRYPQFRSSFLVLCLLVFFGVFLCVCFCVVFFVFFFFWGGGGLVQKEISENYELTVPL